MDNYQYIILFAMIAAFLILRLRSVLGRRTGNERRRELFARRSASPAEKPGADKPGPEKVATPAEPDKVVALADPRRQARRHGGRGAEPDPPRRSRL